MMVTVIPDVISALGTIPQRIDKGKRRFGNTGTSGDHQDYSIIKIS